MTQIITSSHLRRKPSANPPQDRPAENFITGTEFAEIWATYGAGGSDDDEGTEYLFDTDPELDRVAHAQWLEDSVEWEGSFPLY